MTSAVSWDPSPAGVALVLVALTLWSPARDVVWSEEVEVAVPETVLEVEHPPIPVGGVLMALVMACREDGCCSE